MTKSGMRIRDDRTEPWAKCPAHAVREQSRLVGVNGLAVYMAMDACCSRGTHRTNVSPKTIARMLDISRPTVDRAIAKLIEHRWVYRESGKLKGGHSEFILRDIPHLKRQQGAPLFEQEPAEIVRPGQSPVMHPTSKPETSSAESGTYGEQAAGSITGDAPGSITGDAPGQSNGTFGVNQNAIPNKEYPLTTNTSTKPPVKVAGATVHVAAEHADVQGGGTADPSPPAPPGRSGPAKPLDAFAPKAPEVDATGSSMLRRQIIDEIDGRYLTANRVPCTWSKSKREFKLLKDAVAETPQWGQEEWLRCVRNYYASDQERYNPGATPFQVIAQLKEFIAGPRTRFGGVQNGEADRVQARGVPSGSGGKAAERVASNRAAIVAALTARHPGIRLAGQDAGDQADKADARGDRRVAVRARAFSRGGD